MGYAFTYTCDCNKKRFLDFFRRKNHDMNEYGDKELIIWQGRGMMNEFSRKYDREAEAGKYGNDWKELVEKYPEGRFEWQKEVYICPQCEYWGSYDRKIFYVYNYTGEGREFLGLKFKGKLTDKVPMGEVPQACPQCNQIMRVVDIWNEPLICWKCHKKIKIDFKNAIDWD